MTTVSTVMCAYAVQYGYKVPVSSMSTYRIKTRSGIAILAT